MMPHSTQLRLLRPIFFVRPVFAVLFAIAILLSSTSTHAQTTNSSQAKLYFFTQSGCGPCEQMKPSIEWIKQYIAVQTIDTQFQQQWARHFNVMQTPTVIIASGNDVIAKRVGAMSRAELGTFWNQHVSSSNNQKSAQKTSQNLAQSSHQKSNNGSVRQVSYESSQPSNGGGSAKQNAHRSTVRLKIDERGAVSYATGTVIHIHNDEALVVTCGHAFRENRGKGAITGQSGFADGQKNSLTGNLLYYDAGANDVALVVVKPATGLIASDIAAPQYRAKPGERFFSFGCNHGQDPSILECSFLRFGEYSSPDDNTKALRYDTTRRPVQGRSGGGLFNASGQLIGICTGAAVEVDEGIYGSIEDIYRGIQKAGLAQLFNKPSNNSERFVSNNSQTNSQATQRGNQRFNQVVAQNSMTTESHITPVVNRADQANVEIQCNIRSGNSSGQGQQITIRNPSPELLRMLQKEGQLVNQPARTANNNGEVIRAQSHR